MRDEDSETTYGGGRPPGMEAVFKEAERQSQKTEEVKAACGGGDRLPNRLDANIKLDSWQEKVLSHDGSVCLRCGRQVGKSYIVGRKVYEYARENHDRVILVIAAAQRQSSFLFEKIKARFDIDNDIVLQNAKARHDYEGMSHREQRSFIKEHSIYKKPPTRTKIELKWDVTIYCVPTGKTGAFIRCYAVDLLVADEAAYIPESVWTAVVPMLAVSRKQRGEGWMILLSTPFGKGGYYYNCFHDPDFLPIHVSSENCPRIPKDFLVKEKKRMTEVEYAQEYLGEFVDDFRQFFPTSLIRNAMTFVDWSLEEYNKKCRYYLGVDVARYGGDENAFVVAELQSNNNIRLVKALTTSRKSTVDTIGYINKLHDKFRFNKIFVDDGGVGGGVTDALEDKLGKKRVCGINNASKSVDGGSKRRRILKEDLYSHLLILLENSKTGGTPRIDMVNDLQLLRSLKSITFEYTSQGNLRFYGHYSHLTEAAVRACWCLKEKGLKLFIY